MHDKAMRNKVVKALLGNTEESDDESKESVPKKSRKKNDGKKENKADEDRPKT